MFNDTNLGTQNHKNEINFNQKINSSKTSITNYRCALRCGKYFQNKEEIKTHIKTNCFKKFLLGKIWDICEENPEILIQTKEKFTHCNICRNFIEAIEGKNEISENIQNSTLINLMNFEKKRLDKYDEVNLNMKNHCRKNTKNSKNEINQNHFINESEKTLNLNNSQSKIQEEKSFFDEKTLICFFHDNKGIKKEDKEENNTKNKIEILSKIKEESEETKTNSSQIEKKNAELAGKIHKDSENSTEIEKVTTRICSRSPEKCKTEEELSEDIDNFFVKKVDNKKDSENKKKDQDSKNSESRKSSQSISNTSNGQTLKEPSQIRKNIINLIDDSIILDKKNINKKRNFDKEIIDICSSSEDDMNIDLNSSMFPGDIKISKNINLQQQTNLNMSFNLSINDSFLVQSHKLKNKQNQPVNKNSNNLQNVNHKTIKQTPFYVNSPVTLNDTMCGGYANYNQPPKYKPQYNNQKHRDNPCDMSIIYDKNPHQQHNRYQTNYHSHKTHYLNDTFIEKPTTSKKEKQKSKIVNDSIGDIIYNIDDSSITGINPNKKTSYDNYYSNKNQNKNTSFNEDIPEITDEDLSDGFYRNIEKKKKDIKANYQMKNKYIDLNQTMEDCGSANQNEYSCNGMKSTLDESKNLKEVLKKIEMNEKELKKKLKKKEKFNKKNFKEDKSSEGDKFSNGNINMNNSIDDDFEEFFIKSKKSSKKKDEEKDKKDLDKFECREQKEIIIGV